MSEHLELSFGWRGLQLVGSLHLPSGSGPHPAVLMAQGSGPADRDSEGYFEPIRQSFTSRGIATFAFDKPGCGESSGDWRHYGLEGRAGQVVAALDVVRNHPAVAVTRVGIWGHSQGGWLVQRIAGESNGLAFAIASSAPTIGVQDQILYDCEQTLRNDGYDDRHIQDALTLTQALHRAAIDDADFETISAQLLAPASEQPWYDSFPTLVGTGDWHHVKMLVREPHDPISDLKGVSCPFLAVYGARDQLLPAWRGAEETSRALADSPTSDATVVVFPMGDHRMQEGEANNFVEGYLDLLADWTSQRAEYLAS